MHKTILLLLLASTFLIGETKAQTPIAGPPYSNQGPYIAWNNLTEQPAKQISSTTVD